MRVSILDPHLDARVVERRALLYDAGADTASDRPRHVRAASSLVTRGGKLAVVQDDALFVALVDGDAGMVEALSLPAIDGVRQFDDRRGNKAAKLDLEAAMVLGDRLVVLGSGATAARERMVVIEPSGNARVIDATAFYAELRATAGFAGGELNLEGAVTLGARVRLFSRGNGRSAAGVDRVNACGDVTVGELVRWLDDPYAPLPRLHDVVRWDLGRLGGLPLGFTDATCPEAVTGRADSGAASVLYVAAAEDSPDAVRDGPVAGSAVGIISADGTARWAPLRDPAGAVLAAKVEGIALAPRAGAAGASPSDNFPGEVWVVVDGDDPEAAAELWRVVLEGRWCRPE